MVPFGGAGLSRQQLSAWVLGCFIVNSMFKVVNLVQRKSSYFNVVQAIVQAVAWFLIAPTLDILIYAEPANKVFTQAIGAGLANIVSVGILGTFLLLAYAKTRTKKGSLSYEE